MRNWVILGWMLPASCIVITAWAEPMLYHISPGDVSQTCWPDGMSADGSTVVGRFRQNSQWLALRWNPMLTERFAALGPGEDKTLIASRSYDASEDGSVIVGECTWENAQQFYPMVWINDMPIHFDSSFGISAFAVSDDGRYIVVTDTFYHTGFFKNVPYLWDFSTTPPRKEQGVIYPEYVPMSLWSPPDYPPASLSGAYPLDVSGNGLVIVGYSQTAFANNAVRWYHVDPFPADPYWDVTTLQQYPDSESSQAVGASYDGKHIVGNDNFLATLNNVEDYYWLGYLWAYGSPQIKILYPLEGHNHSKALDVSGDGSVVVGHSGNTTGPLEAVYWDETGIHRLTERLDHLGIDYTGWTFESIAAVNKDGSSMAGTGTTPHGVSQAWHLHKAYEDGYADADEYVDDWYNQTVIGIFWRAGNSHVWHNQHGWQKMARGKNSEIRLYDYGTDSWIWTSDVDYPFMYRYGTHPGWVYYNEGGKPGERVFYHFSQEKWMTELELSGG